MKNLNGLAHFPPRCTVWCGLWAGGIIGPYFFEDEAGDAVTVNGDRYRDMLTNFAISEIIDLNVPDMWIQQDGAKPHTMRATIELLREDFGERIISGGTDCIWPPRSCDLTPLDYFLWGYVKDRVYVDAPASIQELQDEIIRVIRGIDTTLLESVIENLGKRLVACKKSRGGHLADIHFHT